MRRPAGSEQMFMGRESLTALSVRDATPAGSLPPVFLGRDVTDRSQDFRPSPQKRQPIHPAASDFRDLIEQAVDLARILTGADGSAVAFRKEQGTICLARSGDGAPSLGARVDLSAGICKRCLESGTLLWSDNAVAIDPEISDGTGTRAVAVAPICRGREILGILAVFSSAPHTFNRLHLMWLQQLAGWIGSAQSRRSIRPLPNRSAAPPVPTRVLHDVFIESPLPWRRFIQSVLLHVIAIAAFLAFSAFSPQVLPVSTHPLRDAHITYYPPSFPAYASSRPLPRTRRQRSARRDSAETRDSASHRSSLAHAAVQSQKINQPPSSIPDVAAINSRRLQKPGLDSAVSPAPDLAEANSHQLRLPKTSVIAPPPELSGRSGLRSINAPVAAVVQPSPDLRDLGTSSARDTRRIGIGSASNSIVPPSPSLDNRALAGNRTAGVTPGARVIAAPPTIEPGLVSGATVRGASLGGVVPIVPPPPSLTGKGNSFGAGRSNSLAAGGPQIVPPPPSLAGTGNSLAGGRSNSLAAGGSQIVPPPPSLATTGALLGGGRSNSVAAGSGGSEIVPPPPSLQVGGNFGGGRGSGSLARGGSEVVPPPPTVSGLGEGNSGSGGRAGALSGAPVAAALAPEANADIPRVDRAGSSKPSTPAADLDLSHRVFQDMQLRVIGLAWAPPRSSYFSNFEVFIAEKRVNKTESQYIKLVYVFLPYQRRLSQYGGEALRVRKLRVTRDSTCDENLMQMMWPEDEGAVSRPGSTVAPSSQKRDDLLPCYITTAEDYLRAISR